MQVNSVNSYSYNMSVNKQQPTFGRVIKSRFFEVMPDGSKKQIQDIDTLKQLCKRLTYHLSEPWKEKKNRIGFLSKFLKKVDSDYDKTPIVRRIFNFNRPKDHCFYLITGDDVNRLNWTAFVENGADKKNKIIEHHWKVVRDDKNVYMMGNIKNWH